MIQPGCCAYGGPWAPIESLYNNIMNDICYCGEWEVGGGAGAFGLAKPMVDWVV